MANVNLLRQILLVNARQCLPDLHDDLSCTRRLDADEQVMNSLSMGESHRGDYAGISTSARAGC